MEYKSKNPDKKDVKLKIAEWQFRITSDTTRTHGIIIGETQKAWKVQMNIGHKYIDQFVNKADWIEIK